MAPGTSLFQVDDSRRWCNCIDVMFLLRKGENDIHGRKPSACLCAGTIPAAQTVVSQHSWLHWKPASQHADKELTKHPPSFLHVRCSVFLLLPSRLAADRAWGNTFCGCGLAALVKSNCCEDYPNSCQGEAEQSKIRESEKSLWLYQRNISEIQQVEMRSGYLSREEEWGRSYCCALLLRV